MTKSSPYEPGRDSFSPNLNLAPVTSETSEDGRLMIGGIPLSELAETFGTPLYVIDEESIRSACKAYQNALVKYYSGPSLPLYASKANSSLVISKLVASEGFGLDVVSEGELLTALRAGVNPTQIFLHGNNKSDRELLLAYKNDVTIVLDNQNDIDRLKVLIGESERIARLMLRFTPGIECHTHEYIRTGHLDSKFGFDPDQLQEVLYQLKDINWGSLNGLHAHIGSQIFELEPHNDLAEVMADALLLARNMGHDVQDLNFGGGLGIKYVASDNPPSIDKWVQVISRSVIAACKSRSLELPRLMCEPGRSLVASAGVTLYRLGAKKKIPDVRTYLSVDGGMSDNPRPITYQSLYSACLADSPCEPVSEIVTIAGKHCESGDVILKDFPIPNYRVGDVLVVFSTGAYNSSMSSNYNRIPRPATVIVNKGNAELVQIREEPEDLLRYDLLPERFRR